MSDYHDDNFHMVVNEYIDVSKDSKFRHTLAEAIVDYCKNGINYLVNPEAESVDRIIDVCNYVASGGPDPNIHEMFDTESQGEIESANYTEAIKIALNSIHNRIDNPYAIEYSSPKY